MEPSVAPYRDEFKIAAPTASCRPAGFGASRSRCLGCIPLRIQHFLCCTPYLHGTHAETCCWRKSFHDGVRTPFCHCGTVRLSEPAVRRLRGWRRLHHANGRVCNSSEIQAPNKGDCAKERSLLTNRE